MAPRIFLLILTVVAAFHTRFCAAADDCASVSEREFVLSRVNPKFDQFQIELLEIYQDGRTAIKVSKPSGGFWLKSTKPGDFFDGGPFGESGLKLVESSFAEHTARFLWRNECKRAP